jgi:hypothetical protein
VRTGFRKCLHRKGGARPVATATIRVVIIATEGSLCSYIIYFEVVFGDGFSLAKGFFLDKSEICFNTPIAFFFDKHRG